MKQNSIVLITVDCLRADHVGFMGYPRPTTPFLDTLAFESCVFPTAIVSGMPTYYSLPALLASRYPLALGRDVLGVAPGEPTLASALKHAGYATAAFAAANPYINPRFGYEQGFDAFCDFSNESSASAVTAPALAGNGRARRLNQKLENASAVFGPLHALYSDLYFEYCQWKTPVPSSAEALRPFPSADVIVNEACKWLASAGQEPVFLWLHFMDPHSPYYPKEEALTLMGDPAPTPFRARYWNSYWNRSDLGPGRLARQRSHVVRLYDAGIRWVDEQVARLVGFLRQSNRWASCIFAVTADHGEEFLDHQGRYHAPTRLPEELIHVPLILRVPGMPKKVLPDAPFGLVDLAPTVLDAAEVRVPAEFSGKSRWNEVRQGTLSEGPVLTECVSGCTNPFRAGSRVGPRILTVREKRFKLVLFFDPPAEYFYDLESDPNERVPIALESQKPARRRLLEVARAHMFNSAQWSGNPQRWHALLRDLRFASASRSQSQSA